MADTRKRLDHMRSEPHVSLTVVGKDQWYNQVTLRGRVAEIADDELDALADSFSLANCVRRTRLCQILASSMGAAAGSTG